MEITPTRSALLEARDDRHVMGEGFRFLDEKRLLLAAEIVLQFKYYNGQREQFEQIQKAAMRAMQDALMRHGFQGFQLLQPAVWDEKSVIQSEKRVFFGVTLVEKVFCERPRAEDEPAMDFMISPESRRCKTHFLHLVEQSSLLAALSGNLYRLLAEYKRTERRARALEDVILPELDETIHEVDLRLEEMEQEEAVRVRLGSKHQNGTERLL